MKNSNFKATPFGKLFNDYLDWVTENWSEPILSDRNFFLYLMDNEDVKQYLSKFNEKDSDGNILLDANALDMWVTKEIKKEQNKNTDFSKEDLEFDSETPIAGFFGKVYNTWGDDTSWYELLNETVMSMESAYNFYAKNTSNYHLFGFTDDDNLYLLRSFGLTKDVICPDLAYESLIKTYDNNDFDGYGILFLEESLPKESSFIIKKKFDNSGFNEKLLSEIGAVRLTEQAREGKLSSVIGRDKELDNLGRIMCRVEKPNAIITGGAGVGKTALIEGFAQRIVDGNVPPKIQGREVISLNLNSLKSGNMYRGMLEEKIQKLVEEIRRTNSILYIDEIHMLKSKDKDDENLANVLKTEITKGDITVIGATTTAEYTKSISRDPAFSRRFQEIKLSEPNREMTINILKNLKKKYEYNYEIIIPEKMVEDVVDLSSRFMRRFKQPDAAKTLLDDSCSFVTGERLTIKDIHKSLSELTSVPASDLSISEQAKVMSMPETIGEHVIGQTSALNSIRNSLLHQMILPSEHKPKATYLFCGPSGVGKTQIAKDLAELLNTELVTFNMSEYQQSNDVGKLVGAAPGYIGYEEGGLLVNKVNENPCAVILFDEIEKAHPDIYKVLLQVMDEGKLSDNQGNTAHFNNSIVIMTSNAGYGHKEGRPVVGYRQPEQQEVAAMSKEKLIESLHKTFKPEFLGRIGSENIIAFQPLDMESSIKIVDNQLKDFSKRFEKKYQISINFDEGLKEHIAKAAIKPEFGARNLSAYINSNIISSVSQAFVKKEINKGDNITLSAPKENSKELIITKPMKSISLKRIPDRRSR